MPTGSAGIRRGLSDLRGYEVVAGGIPVGRLSELLLDAGPWAVRWLVVEGRGRALAPAEGIAGVDEAARTVTLREGAALRDAADDPPDPRRLADLPLAWGGVGVWGPGAEPLGPAGPPPPPPPPPLPAPALVRSRDLIGARLEGGGGVVADLIAEEEGWRLERVVVDSPEGRVELPPAAIAEVDPALGLVRIAPEWRDPRATDEPGGREVL